MGLTMKPAKNDFLCTLKTDQTMRESPRSKKLRYENLVWTSTNRHTTIVDAESLPFDTSNKDLRLLEFLRIFQLYLKPICAECLATWILVFWACMLQPGGAEIEDDRSHALRIALAAGTNLTIIITMFWDICVIQFNPCITFAFAISGVISRQLLIPNIIAQCIGSTIAAYMAQAMRGMPVGSIPINDESDIMAIFWAEFSFTFIMTLVALASLVDSDYYHPLTPLVIGLTVTQGVFGGWYIGAGCMNPARVFGPAITNNEWNYHWIWWLSEFAGAAFAVAVEVLLLAPITTNTAKRSPLIWFLPKRLEKSKLNDRLSGLYQKPTLSEKVRRGSVMVTADSDLNEPKVLSSNTGIMKTSTKEDIIDRRNGKLPKSNTNDNSVQFANLEDLKSDPVKIDVSSKNSNTRRKSVQLINLSNRRHTICDYSRPTLSSKLT